MFKTEDIAIVILTWNGKLLLEQFLPSVIANSKNASIYLADNASGDGSVDFVSSHFPLIRIIQNSGNFGYAKGYNEALKHVKEPLICLLNNDVEVTKNWLDPILNEFNTNAETAIIQPKILDYNQKSYFEYAGAAGGFIDQYGYPFCRGRIFETVEHDHGQYDDTTAIFWASGACFFIRSSIFETLNGFDESYFAHMEEIDLCWRTYNHKQQIKYVGFSTVFHVGGATLNNENPEKTFLNFRNSLFTLVKNTDKNVFLRTLARLTLDGIAAIRFLIQLKPAHFVAILKSHGAFYLNLKRLLRLRREQPKRSYPYEIKSIVWSYFIERKTKF